MAEHTDIDKVPDEMEAAYFEDLEGLAEKAESPWSVYFRRFRKHTLGRIGLIILVILYLGAILADWISPFSMTWTDKSKSFHPPTSITLFQEGAFSPFVYEQRVVSVAQRQYSPVPMRTLRVVTVETVPGRTPNRALSFATDVDERKAEVMNDIQKYYRLDADDPILQRLSKEIDTIEAVGDIDEHRRIVLGTRNTGAVEQEIEVWLTKGNKNYLRLFSEGIPYRFLNLFATNRHLLTSPTGGYFPMGTDQLGRDLFSRLLHGSRLSLSVGLLGAALTFMIGIVIGGLAGYFGGIVDTLLMRFTEIVIAFPSLYLLFALRSSFPSGLSSSEVYLLIIIILSLVGWATLARIIRGMVLSIKTEDYVLSARTIGISHWKILTRHILPNTFSFSIIQVTLAIPGYILGESALSLLGLGITEPQASWGLMLSVARNTRVIQDFPWVLIPGVAIFLAILAWNFFGDGVRDSMDPRSRH